MCCLRKQIEPSQAFHDVFPLPHSVLRILSRCRQRYDLPNVPCLSVYITTHIHDRLRAERKQLPDERFVAALTGRVYDERGTLGWEVANGVKDLRSISGAEGYLVRESVQLRVVRRKADRVGRELDTSDFGEMRGKGEREKAGAAVGVDEVGWRWRVRGGGSAFGREYGVANV